MIAHNFQSDPFSSVFDYREKNKRRVVYVYDEEMYNGSKTHPSLMHLCPWRNTHPHSVTGAPVTSVDQFVMSLGKLTYGSEYHFEVIVIQYDTSVIAGLDGDNNQFYMNARRLLSSDPSAAFKEQAMHRHAHASRKLFRALSAMDTDDLTNGAMMPQGVAHYEPTPGAEASLNQGFGGFVVGPAQQSTTNGTSETEIKDKNWGDFNEDFEDADERSKLIAWAFNPMEHMYGENAWRLGVYFSWIPFLIVSGSWLMLLWIMILCRC